MSRARTYVELDGVDLAPFRQTFEYEHIHSFCWRCGKVGHHPVDCGSLPSLMSLSSSQVISNPSFSDVEMHIVDSVAPTTPNASVDDDQLAQLPWIHVQQQGLKPRQLSDGGTRAQPPHRSCGSSCAAPDTSPVDHLRGSPLATSEEPVRARPHGSPLVAAEESLACGSLLGLPDLYLSRATQVTMHEPCVGQAVVELDPNSFRPLGLILTSALAREEGIWSINILDPTGSVEAHGLAHEAQTLARSRLSGAECRASLSHHLLS